MVHLSRFIKKTVAIKKALSALASGALFLWVEYFTA